MFEDQHLDAMADSLVEASTSADGFGQSSQLIRVVGDGADDEWEFGVKDLEGEHPAQTLLGFTAPADWLALGLITGGWAAPPDGSGRVSAHPDAVRVRMVTLVSRRGHVASRLRTADGRAIDEPGEGFMLDVLLRALGLPTAPPAVATTELLGALWLAQIAAAAEEARRFGSRRLTWNRVARLHPALQLLATGGSGPRINALVPAARALGNVLTWERVREQAAERSWLAGLVSQDIAQWMDEGMLARWLMGELGAVADLAPQVSRLLRTDVAAQLNDTLCELGVASTAAA